MKATLESSKCDPRSVGGPDPLIHCPTCGAAVDPETAMRYGWHGGGECPEATQDPSGRIGSSHIERMYGLRPRNGMDSQPGSLFVGYLSLVSQSSASAWAGAARPTTPADPDIATTAAWMDRAS